MQIILHIGAWKTGSSAIQLFLARNANLLEKQNVFLPSIVQKELGHTLLFQALKSSGPELNNLLDELKLIGRDNPGAKVVISSEHFWPLSSEEIAALAMALHSVTSDIRVLMYLRPQDEMWASIYAQQTKSFRVRPDAPVWGTGDFVAHPILEWALYYHKCLGTFGAEFGEDAITPRLYHRDRFPEQDIIFDFLDLAGIDRDPEFDRYEGDTNPSYGWKSVALSLWFVGAAYGEMRKANSMQDIRRAFRSAIGDMHARKNDLDWLGKAPNVLSGQDRRDIRAHYAEDNLALFDRYFEGKDVFGPPEDSKKTVLDHNAIPEAEFNRVRKRMLKYFRRANLDMGGAEDLFRSPAKMSLTGVRKLFSAKSN